MRALIVDDSRFVRDYLRGLLEEKGIECEEAADGLAGLVHLHEDAPFDLALVDWNMPVMDGLEYAQKSARRRLLRYESDDGHHRGRGRLHHPLAGRRSRRIPDEALRQ
jgi:CheY-like chemotaxis protein